MKLRIEDIIVDERIRTSLGDIDSLAKDMKVNGQIVPITVRIADDGQYHLVAGFRRMKAMQMNGEETIEAYAIVEDDEEMLLLKEISENEIRETFTRTERMSYIRRLDEIEGKKAKERQGTRTDIVQNSAPSQKARDAVAEQVGISHDTIAREKKIIEHKEDIPPQDFADWDEGKLSTNKVYTALKAKLAAKEQELSDALEGNRKLASTNKDLEAESLKWKNAWQTQELPEATVEEIEELKEQVESYKHSEEVLRSDNQKLVEDRDKWRQLYKESGRVEPTLDEKANKDMDYLTVGINAFLRNYGSNAWSIERRASIPEHKTKELAKQAKLLLAFATNLYELVKGEEE